MSKVEGVKRMVEWNTEVDRFLAEQKDPWRRPQKEIELVNKIGPDGGPLYKRCENTGCPKQQRPGAEIKLQQCSGCKRVSSMTTVRESLR